MPTYTYQCQSCAAMLDVFRKIVDMDLAPDRCEACGKEQMSRIMTAPAGFFRDGGHNGEYNKTGPRKGNRK